MLFVMEPTQPTLQTKAYTPDQLIEAVAETLYTGYCEHTGFKSLASGDDLPRWEALKVDRPKIAEAWRASAAAGIRFLSSIGTAGIDLKYPEPLELRPEGKLLEGIGIGQYLGVPKDLTFTLKLDPGNVTEIVRECIRVSNEIDQEQDASGRATRGVPR